MSGTASYDLATDTTELQALTPTQSADCPRSPQTSNVSPAAIPSPEPSDPRACRVTWDGEIRNLVLHRQPVLCWCAASSCLQPAKGS